MKTPQFKIMLASLAVLALSYSQAWAGRILINDDHQTVTLTRSLDCFNAAQISIDTRNPGIYEPGSQQLQTIADTVRAMLSYECPGLSEINISGLIRGLDETVYQGSLQARDNWKIEAVELNAPKLTTLPIASAVSNNEPFSLTGLKLGMTIAAAIEAVETAFEISPQYDSENGMMTMLTGGCPADFNFDDAVVQASSEWKCLKVWFSDKRVPALERVELIQVVNSDTHTVKQLLTGKYGPPTVDDSSGSRGSSHMVWHTENLEINGIESLDASISLLETELILTHLSLANQATRFQATATPDIGLRL